MNEDNFETRKKTFSVSREFRDIKKTIEIARNICCKDEQWKIIDNDDVCTMKMATHCIDDKYTY